MEKIKIYKIFNKKLISVEVMQSKLYDFKQNGWDVITIDNIDVYYNFMSDEDLQRYQHEVELMLNSRRIDIALSLDIGYFSLKEKIESHLNASSGILKYSLFGVKDTLKPIDEFIEQIKASDDYKEYKGRRCKI
jgi:methionine synthase II (cobalamin-independent)